MLANSIEEIAPRRRQLSTSSAGVITLSFLIVFHAKKPTVERQAINKIFFMKIESDNLQAMTFVTVKTNLKMMHMRVAINLESDLEICGIKKFSLEMLLPSRYKC